jgi:hypothetical protein
MIFSIEALRGHEKITEGFVKDVAVAGYILDKSAGDFYFTSANRCEFLHLNFMAKSPFPDEPVQANGKISLIFFSFILLCPLPHPFPRCLRGKGAQDVISTNTVRRNLSLLSNSIGGNLLIIK